MQETNRFSHVRREKFMQDDNFPSISHRTRFLYFSGTSDALQFSSHASLTRMHQRNRALVPSIDDTDVSWNAPITGDHYTRLVTKFQYRFLCSQFFARYETYVYRGILANYQMKLRYSVPTPRLFKNKFRRFLSEFLPCLGLNLRLCYTYLRCSFS